MLLKKAGHFITRAALCAAALSALPLGAGAGTSSPSAPQGQRWPADIEINKSEPAPGQKAKNTTVIEREGEAGSATLSALKLVALLTADGQQIDQGLIWRVYQNPVGGSKAKLITENREASPSLKVPPGDYTVNAAFGRANLTRKISIKPGAAATEQFVLNAGGLRVNAIVGGKPAPPGSVTYAIYSDDRDQAGNRSAVMSGAKPNLIIRLNSGIYRIVSTYGDANAKIETGVTVEAGKMTEASVIHEGGMASFKLVAKPGGDALPETHWSVQDKDGETVKESVGALPTHILAPGSYTALARAAGHTYKSSFAVKNGELAAVEVIQSDAALAAGGETIQPALDIQPSLTIKSP